MKKITAMLIIISLISKVFGFTRDIALSYFFGASMVTDAYIISLTVPGVIFSFIGLGISTGYIPIFSKLDSISAKEANKFTINLINILIILSTLIVLLTVIFAEPIVKLFASGFEGQVLNLAVLFTRVSIASIYFHSIIYIFNGYLQLKGKFIIPAIAVIPFNLTTIIMIYLGSQYGLILLAVGNLLSVSIQALVLIIYAYKAKYKHSCYTKISDSNIKQLLFFTIPLILGTSVNQINRLVDRTIASSIVEGGISALNYANKLNDVIMGVFVMSLVTVMYPKISKNAAEGDFQKIKKAVSESISLINLVAVPATIGFMIFSSNIVLLLFGRGAFDTQALSMTSGALFYYSIGLTAIALRKILSRTFYAFQDTKTPMINSTIAMGTNIILNIILSKIFGLNGLAIASTIAAVFTTILLFFSLRKKIGPFGMKQISISFLKILFASLIMGRLAKLSFNYLAASLSQNLSLILAIGVGVVSYFVIIYFMKIEEVDVIVGAIKKKLRIGTA